MTLVGGQMVLVVGSFGLDWEDDVVGLQLGKAVHLSKVVQQSPDMGRHGRSNRNMRSNWVEAKFICYVLHAHLMTMMMRMLLMMVLLMMMLLMLMVLLMIILMMMMLLMVMLQMMLLWMMTVQMTLLLMVLTMMMPMMMLLMMLITSSPSGLV